MSSPAITVSRPADIINKIDFTSQAKIHSDPLMMFKVNTAGESYISNIEKQKNK